MSYKEIIYEVRDNVAWITINRPEVHNAFREQTLDELIDAFKSTKDDQSIAVAVVTGAGDRPFVRRRLLRHDETEPGERHALERPDAGSRDDNPRAFHSGCGDGERLVHGRRP